VGARVDQDLGRSAVQRQDLQDVAHVTPLVRARVQLAVAIGPRAALPEAIVAVGVDTAPAGQSLQVATARLNRLAAVDDDTGDTGAGELIRAEQAARAVPHDHHPCLATHLHRVGCAQQRGVGDAEAEATAAVFRRELEQQVVAHPAAPAVERPLAQDHGRQGLDVDAQLSRHPTAQRIGVARVVEPELQRHLAGQRLLRLSHGRAAL
jgi:hypothetical protein